MAKKTQFITSALFLLLGFFIFGVSLIMASQIGSQNFPKVSERKLYVSERILPDHILYPLLMVADRLILETSFGNRKIYVRIRLANDRLHSAKMLMEKNQEELALSTMTKSQKYLISATQDFLRSDEKLKSIRKDLLTSIRNNSQELKRYRKDFQIINTAPIDNLLVELSILINQLES